MHCRRYIHIRLLFKIKNSLLYLYLKFSKQKKKILNRWKMTKNVFKCLNAPHESIILLPLFTISVLLYLDRSRRQNNKNHILWCRKYRLNIMPWFTTTGFLRLICPVCIFVLLEMIFLISLRQITEILGTPEIYSLWNFCLHMHVRICVRISKAWYHKEL